MIWAIIFGIAVVFIFNIVSNNFKDKVSLAGTSLEEKFSILISKINDEAFNGEAIVTKGSINGCLNIFNPNGSQHFVEIMYSYGNLQITWKYKYYQKEMIYNRSFLNIRNLSSFEEIKVANILIQEVSDKIENHKLIVMKDLY
ncbi:hypothetical protein [Flavobacterium nackdongense]|uniref:Uncharacterized protein n=1 Tax=Flavobacterium nackdongense TaxID=2547394 RepID=A0A4P6YGY9_9FLAO|nr:hypothetical protein [Flavobacterium nackdongense]QBN19753.1 hypothetical protein E1750_13385 [Flavobacterium nackdongense]